MEDGACLDTHYLGFLFVFAVVFVFVFVRLYRVIRCPPLPSGDFRSLKVNGNLAQTVPPDCCVILFLVLIFFLQNVIVLYVCSILGASHLLL